MSGQRRYLCERAPDLNPDHMVALAVSIGSTLDGMPTEFFDEIVSLAHEMGPARLAEFCNGLAG